MGWATVLIIFRNPDMLNPFSMKWLSSGTPQCILGGMLSALAFRAISLPSDNVTR